jgi:hypothetical protein
MEFLLSSLNTNSLNSSPATPIISFFDLRRNLPYFYDTLWVQKFTPVAAINVIPDAPWWSEALTHTIACGRAAT